MSHFKILDHFLIFFRPCPPLNFTGREGKWGTSRRLRERLFDELRHNVALRVEETDSAENFTVSGRGELHLAILIENMQREGYEFQVSRPEVLLRQNAEGETLEPFEEVHVETSSDTVGTVVEMLGARRGQMVDMLDNQDGTVRMTYIVPTRGLLGFRHQFLTATRGEGIMHTIFHDYLPLAGTIPSRSNGSLVSWEAGVTTTLGLKNGEERGFLFLEPGVEVYEGMVVGEHQRPGSSGHSRCPARRQCHPSRIASLEHRTVAQRTDYGTGAATQWHQSAPGRTGKILASSN